MEDHINPESFPVRESFLYVGPLMPAGAYQNYQENRQPIGMQNGAVVQIYESTLREGQIGLEKRMEKTVV